MVNVKVSTVLSLLYYNLAATLLKTTRFVLLVKRYFPLIILLLLLLELVLAIDPALNVQAGLGGQLCVFVNKDWSVERRHGLLYNSIFPYILPLVMAIFPIIKLSVKLKESEITEPRKSCVSYLAFRWAA